MKSLQYLTIQLCGLLILIFFIELILYLHPSLWEKSEPRSSGETRNILYHVGGNGPWIRKLYEVVERGYGPPEGCQVEQVHIMSRHAERYPTETAGNRILALLQRIIDANITLEGDLAFVNQWQYFSNGLKYSCIWLVLYELNQISRAICPSWPAYNYRTICWYLSAFKTGTKLRTRYLHFLPQKNSPQIKLWASGLNRVIETARYFSTGLFGLGWSSKMAELIVIPETTNLGANTLTPGNTCSNYKNDTKLGHDYGQNQLTRF